MPLTNTLHVADEIWHAVLKCSCITYHYVETHAVVTMLAIDVRKLMLLALTRIRDVGLKPEFESRNCPQKLSIVLTGEPRGEETGQFALRLHG